MLINAQDPEAVRVAVLDGESLESYQIEVAERGLTRGNIYRGVIANIQPSLNAAFIDYGTDKHGFLAIQDVVPDAYYRQPANGGRARIEEVLERGKPIVVQVQKEPEGSKGAALTTNLSLAGRYLVLTPFDPVVGVSRKVEEEESRRHLKELAASLKVPEGCGVIVRTNAHDQSKVTLNRDLAALLRVWKRVEAEARQGRGTRLLYSDQDLLTRAVRDFLDGSITEVLVDDDAAFEKAAEYMRAFMPRTKTKLVRYAERTPLFARFDLEPQIDRIYERTVPLPAGGSLVIDRTEALTAIDVNSGRATRASSQEETALLTNLEAAREVARQLRLRDIGGLVVVDFIDMRSQKSQRKVEKELREAMKADKARSTVGKISSNGLLEINRQRIQQALLMRTHRPCPTCGGMGRISSPEMVALALLRRIEARAATGSLKAVKIGLHPELADSFQNSRRRELAALEQEFDLRVEIHATTHLRRSEQKIEWIDREAGDERPRPVPPRAAVPAVASVTALPLPDLDDEDEEEEGSEAGAAEGAAGEARRRARRRRRGGKRRRGGAAEAGATGEGQAAPRGGAQGGRAAAPAAPGAAITAREAQDGAGEAPAPNGAAGETGPRKRRRRRGGRKRGGARANGPDAAAGAPAEGGEPAAVPGAAAPPESAGERPLAAGDSNPIE
jgi:ribonuclease E